MIGKALYVIYDQMFRPIPPVEVADLTGKTIVVTGANTGMGLEAAKHFARMNPTRLILACRSEERGNAALSTIKETTGCQTAELWLLDLSKFSSVIAFANKFEVEGVKLDILVANAAVGKTVYETTSDGWEETFQVNCLSTSLLWLLLLPRMIEASKASPGSHPRIVTVTSESHEWLNLEDAVYSAPSPLRFVSAKDRCTSPRMMNMEIYYESKLVNLFLTFSLSELLKNTPIIATSVTPGYCNSELTRHFVGVAAHATQMMQRLFARTAEEGARQLVFGAVGEAADPQKLRGAYISLHKVLTPSDHMLGDAGMARRDALWNDLIRELSAIDERVPDILRSLETV